MDDPTTSAWRQHRTAVLKHLRRRLGDQALAEDIAQETFLRLHRTPSTPSEPPQLRAWLLRTAHNLLVDHYRAHRNDVSLDEARHVPAAEPAAWRALEPCIEPLAQRLPAVYRDALQRDLDGVPQQVIAAAQGVSLSGAKSRIQRARQLLAREFVRCCGDDPADGACA